jgi:hypothetical protein
MGEDYGTAYRPLKYSQQPSLGTALSSVAAGTKS